MDSSPAHRSDNGEVAFIETPRFEERILFAGANGSGKTILASVLSEPYPRVTVLDVKGDYPIPWTEQGTDWVGIIVWGSAALLLGGIALVFWLTFPRKPKGKR